MASNTNNIFNTKKAIVTLTSQPPSVYAVIYIVLIPVFALLYLCNPEGFYQSTVYQEGAINLHETKIESSLQKCLFGDIGCDSNNTDTDKRTSLSKWMNVSNFTDRDFSLKVLPRNRLDLLWSFDIVTIEQVSNAVGYVYTTGEISLIARGIWLDGNSVSPIKILIKHKPPSGRIHPMLIDNGNRIKSLDDVFPHFTKIAEHTYQLDLDGRSKWELFYQLKAYYAAVNGEPTNIGANVIRMMYFSIVTITTLGYGDIVPLSNTARCLVSLESILGIVVIGLFLNSLSMRRKDL